jgi:hypothetical protein
MAFIIANAKTYRFVQYDIIPQHRVDTSPVSQRRNIDNKTLGISQSVGSMLVSGRSPKSLSTSELRNNRGKLVNFVIRDNDMGNTVSFPSLL